MDKLFWLPSITVPLFKVFFIMLMLRNGWVWGSGSVAHTTVPLTFIHGWRYAMGGFGIGDMTFLELYTWLMLRTGCGDDNGLWTLYMIDVMQWMDLGGAGNIVDINFPWTLDGFGNGNFKLPWTLYMVDYIW